MTEKTILLVEDDFLNRRLSKKILAENGYRILEAKNAKETVEILKKEIVDLVILDINLGENEEDGISIGKYINENYTLPYIYLTAYENPEIIKRAVSSSPYSYLTKPFKNVDLITSVEIAIRQFGNQKKQVPVISVKDNEYNVDLPIDEIDYIVSDGNYILFHSGEKIYKSRSTIKQIMEILPESVFIQVHRAYVVNKSKIEKYCSNSLVVKDVVIPVSKNYIDLSNGL